MTPSKPDTDTPLERYFKLLEIVAAFPSGIGIGPLAEIVDLPRTTVNRLLKGLVNVQVLEAHPTAPNLYCVGGRIRKLLYRDVGGGWMQAVADTVLGDIAAQAGQTCFVAKFEDLQVRSVAMVTPDDPSSGYVVPGRLLALHAAASAKAILAFQDEVLVRRILPRPLPALTDRTTTSLERLLEEFARIRRDGIAVCQGEDYQGFGGLACPIELPKVGVIFSVGLSGLLDTLLGPRRPQYEALVREAASRIRAAIEAKANGEAHGS